MKCPHCASDNANDATECASCQASLHRKPAEPQKLDSLDALQALMKTALAELAAQRMAEAQRLTMRIFSECALEDCKAFIAISGNVWLDSVNLSGERAEVAKHLIGAGAILIGRGIFKDALGAFMKANELAADRPNQNLMFPLLIFGLKGVVGAADSKADAPSKEPGPLKTEADITGLLEAAWNAARAGRLDEGRRLAGRLFIEVELAECAKWVQNAGRLWIQSVKLPPAQAAVANGLIANASDFVKQEKFAEALPLLEQAAGFAANAPVQHPAFPVLLMGIKGAIEDQQLRARYKALVAQGVQAMAAPGGKEQAAVCFEQAMALLPTSPRTEAENKIRRQLEGMIKAARS
jgi:tetratricopeptide (TPR) repeat protein